ncbi:catecholate siderophore receptor Fiu [Massilia sp. S19_KUP03_FR1]|uniref:catecholate siderophore receptor Fiu n=1 Tax=Massilia sp. S19_KUP03_FR1 TaxID=3025503 RepID=UPI002FCCD3C7
MSHIKSRKHAANRFNPQMSAAIAAMLLPLASGYAHAAPDAPAAPANIAADEPVSKVVIVGTNANDFKADKAASSKYTEKLVDTAQTIQVIKKELIEQQGALTLTDALRNTPGVGAFFLGENGSTNTGDAIYMRGFDTSASLFVDGVRDVGSISRDVFNIEQIDVLKGPAGTDTGRSAPTGSINLVSKRPSLQDAGAVSVTGGSASQKRVSGDYNTVLDAERGTALRLNAVVQDSGVPGRDEVKNKRWAIAPSLAFGLNGPTRVFVNLLHVKQDNLPDGGVPTIGLPGYTAPSTVKEPLRADVIRALNAAPRVNPDNFYGDVSDYDRVKADMATVIVEHDFSASNKLTNTTRYGRTKQDYVLSAFMSTGANLALPNVADPSTWTLARTTRTIKDQENRIMTNQTNLVSNLGSGWIKHTVVSGLELTREEQSTVGYVTGTFGTLSPANLYNPVHNSLQTSINPKPSGATNDGTLETASVYAFDTVKLGEKWIINGGVRVDHYKVKYDGTSAPTAATATAPAAASVRTRLALDDNLVNGKLSALYKPTPDSSVYALVASSKQPPGSNYTLANTASSAQSINADPQETLTKEIGAKIDLLKQRLGISIALYDTTVKNEVEQDPVSLVYSQTGKKSVKGVEIGITGEIVRKWLVSAGYSRMNTKVENGRVISAIGENALTYTPKQSFTAWTSYTLPIGLQIGGGARFNDRLLRGTDGAVGTPAYVNSYWVFDAMASYPVAKNIDLRLNVYNLGDKEYVAAINKSGYRYTPGTPRSASLTANWRF